MYRIGETWKFEKFDRIVYTGEIIGKEGKQIFLKTIKNEELTVHIDDIKQSKKLKNSIGYRDGSED